MSINSKSPGDHATVDELVSAGKYGEAAARAESLGELERAAELFERVWSFADAARCAERADDLPRALRNAIDARDESEIERLSDQLVATGDDGKRQALEVLSQKRQFALAAPLAEALGQTERAIELYRGGHQDLDAARLLEAAGRHNEAGRLLEKVVTHADVPAITAEAHMRLGRLLARRMRHEDAVRHLQEAARHPDTEREARRMLIVELAALGLRDAARDVLVQARGTDDDLPLDLDEVIRSNRPVQAKQSDLQIIAGRYRIEELLGAGGAGRVYRAHDQVTNRPVAIKLFSTNYAHGHEGFERFVREAKIASSLEHPNLVEAYDFSAEQGYLVMELMSGSLVDRLDPRLSQSAARRMALDVLGGLELAHRRGIIHRDVKPANIFFDARGTAKLGDFGVAHLLDLGQTQTGGLIGTLAYMSPEQITGAPLTIVADLYALGVTLFQALTGRLPFPGPDFVAEHLGAQPPAPTEIDDELAPGWDQIFARLLAKDPGDRFESVDAVRRALLALELGSKGQKPLVLPRARASATRDVVSEPEDDNNDGIEPEEAAEGDERYRFETPLRTTEGSSLTRAVDTVLERSVIIERFEPALDSDGEKRLFGLARCASPFIQRALAYDRNSSVVVFEAPTGTPLADAFPEPPEALTAAHLLKRLGQALAALHGLGHSHGALGSGTVLVDVHGFPTILASGLPPADRKASAAGDTQAVIELLAGVIDVEPRWQSLVEALTRDSSSSTDAIETVADDVPHTGGELLAAGDRLEIFTTS